MTSELINSLIIGINLFTPHVDYHEYNNVTPGIYAQINDRYLIGAVRNSYKDPSFYLARTWNVKGGFTLITGIATGYDYAPIVPLVSIGYKWNLTEDSGIRAQLLPGTHAKGSSITFSYEWKVR